MTITLTLAPELELKLKQAADWREIPLEQYAIVVLDEHFTHSAIEKGDFAHSAMERSEKLAELFEQWNQEEVDDSEALDDEFFKMLDEDRPSFRKLFPSEMKGISW